MVATCRACRERAEAALLRLGQTTLINSTGSPLTDRFLGRLIAHFERAFPGRVRGYYVEGSKADQTSLPTSDLDVTIVFKDRFADDAERHRGLALGTQLAGRTGVELDLDIIEEAGVSAGLSPQLKLGSLPVYGEDIRDAVPILPIAEWARQRMHAAYWLTINVFARPAEVIPPLGYPDASDEFWGYARRKVRLADGTEAGSTRDLVRVTGWIATALIAFKARRYVARKRDCHVAYREAFDDPWSDLLAVIFEQCRCAWNYLIPGPPDERQRLREIGATTLGFENHFLTTYKEFVLAELNGGDPAARAAVRRFLTRTPFRDPEIADQLGCSILG